MSDDWIKILSAWACAAVVAFGIYVYGGYDSFMVAIGRVAPKIEAVASPQPATARAAIPAAAPAAETSGPLGAHASVPNPPARPAAAEPAKRSDGTATVTPAESAAANPGSDAKPAKPPRPARQSQTEQSGSPFLTPFRIIPFFGGLR